MLSDGIVVEGKAVLTGKNVLVVHFFLRVRL